jgi:hypothetical protein
MERVLRAFKDAIESLGSQAIIMPQCATTSGARVELFFSGLSAAGESRDDKKASSWERIRFTANFKSDGTHEKWITETILAARRFAILEENPMTFTVTTDRDWSLTASWKRLQEGRFEYPEEDKGSMPISYVEVWQVDISYPAKIVGWVMPSAGG